MWHCQSKSDRPALYGGSWLQRWLSQKAFADSAPVAMDSYSLHNARSTMYLRMASVPS